jgi:hypothetical protein
MESLLKQWKPLQGFETKYLISNYGEIKNIKTGVIKKPMLMCGYYYIGLSTTNRQTKSCRLHRLVAQTFIPNPFTLPQVNHIDCNKLNNRVDNLEWCSHEQNTIHRDAHNLSNKGEKIPTSKLKEADVLRIRDLRKQGLKYNDIVPMFNVNKSVICAICNYKAWKHVV